MTCLHVCKHFWCTLRATKKGPIVTLSPGWKVTSLEYCWTFPRHTALHHYYSISAPSNLNLQLFYYLFCLERKHLFSVYLMDSKGWQGLFCCLVDNMQLNLSECLLKEWMTDWMKDWEIPLLYSQAFRSSGLWRIGIGPQTPVGLGGGLRSSVFWEG